MDEDRLVKKKQRATRDGDVRALAEIVKELGDRYFEAGKLKEALEEYLEQKEVCLALNDKLNCAVATRMIGDVYIGLGSLDQALVHHKVYLAKAQEAGNLLEEQRAWATLGRTYFLLSETCADDTKEKREKMESAKKAYQKSIKICNRLEELDITLEEIMMMRARLLLNWGLVYEAEKNLEKAIEFYENAEALCTKHGLREELHRIHLTLAAANERCGKYESALACLEQAASVSDPVLRADARLAKAELLLRTGSWPEARKVLVPLYLTKGLSPDKSGQVQKCLRIAVCLCRAEEALLAKTDALGRLRAYEDLGDAAVAANCSERAIEYYKEMLSCAEASGSERLGPALISLARTLKETGRYAEASTYARRELRLCSDPREIGASALFLLKLLIAAKTERREIEECYDVALTNARAAGDSRLEVSALEEFLAYCCEQGDSPDEILKLERRIGDIKDVLSDSDENDEETDTASVIGVDICLEELSDVESEKERSADQSRRTASRERARNVQGRLIKRNAKGETQLHIACIEGNVERVRKLLEMGHPANVRDYCGWTPLHEAANHGHAEIAEILIENGANVNDPGGSRCDGITPLLDAAACGNFETIRLLIKYGADANLRSVDGKTPLDMLNEWEKRSGALSADDAAECSGVRAELSALVTRSAGSKTGTSDDVSAATRDVSDNVRGGRAVKRHIGKAAEDYRRTMELLRNRGISSDTHRPLRRTAGLPALLDTDGVADDDDDDDDEDDWLEDDTDEPATTRRRKHRPGNAQPVSTDFSDRGTKRKWERTSVDSDEVALRSSDGLDDRAESDASDPPTVTESLASPRKKRRRRRRWQTSLLSVGFTKNSTSRTPSPAPTEPACDEFTRSVNENPITIRVFLEERTYDFKLLTTNPNGRTISDLITDIEGRFFNETGCKAKLTLRTTEGLPLLPENPWETTRGAKDPTVLLGDLIEMDIPPAMERYRIICRTFGASPCEPVMKCLRSCENTSVFRLESGAAAGNHLIHLLGALEYQKNLRVLCLSGVSLFNYGKQLNRCLKRLGSLQELLLRECDISNECLGELRSLPERLRVLDLGYNPLTARSLDALNDLLKEARHLQTLNLRSCQLNEFFMPSEVNGIVNLDLSWNPLKGAGVERYLERHLLHLDLSCTNDVSSVRNFLEKHRNECFAHLESLELASCGITDSDVNDILPWLPNLTKFVIRGNLHVSVLSATVLLEREPTLTYIDVSGCKEVTVPPHSSVRIKRPETCTLIVSMTSEVCDSWLRLWNDKGSIDKLPHNVVVIRPLYICE